MRVEGSNRRHLALNPGYGITGVLKVFSEGSEMGRGGLLHSYTVLSPEVAVKSS